MLLVICRRVMPGNGSHFQCSVKLRRSRLARVHVRFLTTAFLVTTGQPMYYVHAMHQLGSGIAAGKAPLQCGRRSGGAQLLFNAFSVYPINWRRKAMLVQVVCLVAPCDWSHKSYDTECSKCRKVYYCSAVCQKQAFILRMGCRLSLKESSVSIFRTSLLTQNVFFSESPVCIQACTRWPAFAMASTRWPPFDAMDSMQWITMN